MEPVKVEAWKALDGTIFLDYDRALRYNQLNAKRIDSRKIFEDNKEHIKNYLLEIMKSPDFWNYRDPEDEDDEIVLDFDPDGWECDNKDNPTGRCIYEWSICDESCIYCGEPEERK